jgi:hypothetical protein
MSIVQTIASGDNTTMHVAGVSVVGGAIAGIVTWGLQLAHMPPPAEVTVSIGILCTVAASYLAQKLS